MFHFGWDQIFIILYFCVIFHKSWLENSIHSFLYSFPYSKTKYLLKMIMTIIWTELTPHHLWLHWGNNQYHWFSCPSWADDVILFSQAWTYHPMLNISVIPQRKYNLAPGVINKLYNTKDAKVASVTSMADKALTSIIALTILVILSRQLSVLSHWLLLL